VKKIQKNTKLGPILACATAFTIWGLNTPLIEKSLALFPLFSLIFLKFLVGAIVFLFLARKNWKKVPAKVWMRITVATLFGYGLNAALFYKGVMLTGGLNASLIYLLAPLMLYFCSIKFLKERYNHKLLFSVVAGFAGTILIVSTPLLVGQSGTRGSLLGNILIILAVVTDVIGTILIKPVLKKVPTLQISAIRSAIGAIMLAPFIVHELPSIAHIQMSTLGTFALGYNLLFASVIAMYLYHWGLARIKGEQISPLQYLDPTVGAIASMIILAERPAATTLLGIVLVFCGLYMGEARKLRLSHHHTTHYR